MATARTFESFAPDVDPATRQLRRAGGTWVAGPPKLLRVMFALTTPFGSFAPDASLGIKFAVAAKPRANLVAEWKAEVTRALGWLTAPREIVLRAVEASLVLGPRLPGALTYAVVFVDPLDPTATAQRTPALVV